MDDPLYQFQRTPLYTYRRNATLSEIAAAPQNFFQPADLAWMMTSSCLVLLMVPGISLFYPGISPSRCALSMWFLPVLTTAVVGLEVSSLTILTVDDQY